MNLFLVVPVLILVVILVVGIHELGHALAARLWGVRILRISLGFGKVLCGFRDRRDIEWVISRWPVGGYVQLQDSRTGQFSPKDAKRGFDRQKPGVRLVILLAGITANLLLAFVLFALVSLSGMDARLPVIGDVVPGSLAASANLLPGDRIQAVKGRATPLWTDVGMALVEGLGTSNLVIRVKRANGAEHTATLDFSHWPRGQARNPLLLAMGIKPALGSDTLMHVDGKTPLQSLVGGWHKLTDYTVFYGVVIWKWISGALPFGLFLGPVAALMLAVDSFAAGLVLFMDFLAQLSVAMAVVNILPLPGLDGGACLYLLIGKIRGKPLSQPLEMLLNRLVVIACMVLFFNLIMNDVLRYVGSF